MRPRRALRLELYSVLDAELSTDVVVQKQTGDAAEELVMIEAPDTPVRGGIKGDTGHEIAQTIRVHTRYAKGSANVGRREEIASNVIDALDGATIDPQDHRVVHWPSEPDDSSPLQYDAGGGEQALDLVLTYEIFTQIKATI